MGLGEGRCIHYMGKGRGKGNGGEGQEGRVEVSGRAGGREGWWEGEW